MMFSIVSGCCILLMTALVVVFFGKVFTLNRVEKIKYIRSFKKGKCAIIYIIALLLSFLANIYEKTSVGVSIFNSIEDAAGLIVLDYDIGSNLLSENIWFAVAMYMCCVLILFNAVMIALSLANQSLWNFGKIKRFMSSKKNKCLIIGYNQASEYIYSSCRDDKMLIDVLSKETCEKLYYSDFCYKNFQNGKRQQAWVETEFVKLIEQSVNNKKKVNIIIDNDDEDITLRYCLMFLNIIANMKDEQSYNYVDVFAFGERNKEEIYEKLAQDSKGCLHYINGSRQIATDFIDKYPLTEYMNDKHIDYKTACLKSDVDINVSFFGFGKVNQQIFLSMVANNQFIEKGEDGEVVPKLVKYHLFDVKRVNGEIGINKYLRYQDAFFSADRCKVNENEYLPLPSLPAMIYEYDVDIHNNSLYDHLNKSVSQKENAINYLIISLGDDYKNIHLANRLALQIKRWNLENTQIFVRIKNEENLMYANMLLDLSVCKIFGNNLDVSYSYDNIIREKFTEMAIKRNYVYDIEKDALQEEIYESTMNKSRFKWYTSKTELERESNIYACLSIRNKLHMMGLDVKAKSENVNGLSFEEFMEIYAKDDMPKIKHGPNQNTYIEYDTTDNPSLRKNLAYQEHQRWNAFIISKGFIPSTKKEISENKDETGRFTNGRDYIQLKHGCLTTFSGLKEYRKLLAERDNCKEAEKDVIKYDYQLLDGAWWLLNQSGFVIVKR